MYSIQIKCNIIIQLVESTYSDCDIRSWNKANKSCQKENVKGYVNNWRCQVDEKVWQCWSYSEKKHIIEQLFPTLCNLEAHKLMLNKEHTVAEFKEAVSKK